MHRWLLFTLFVAIAEGSSDLLTEAKNNEDWIIQIRRRLHKIPELAFDLPKTSTTVREVLDGLGISYRYPVAQSGIIATIGNGNGKVLGLRADMDALPIQEPNDLDFHSQHEGKMHACGHDVHTSMLLGAAKLLKEHESEIQGTVKLVFQPAEEIGSGAKEMLKDGDLDDIAMMFGFHVMPGLPSGLVASRSGTLMAGVNQFNVTITGKGGHASMPTLFTDPYIPLANMILGYQTIISRKGDPLDSNVISVTTIHGGTAFNVMPSEVTFSGTMRSLQQGGVDMVAAQFREMTENIAKTFGCVVDIYITAPVDPVVNHEEATLYASNIARRLFGEDRFKMVDPIMGAEDFTYFGQKFPSSFLFLGIDNSTFGPTGGLHTPELKIDESVLHRGAAFHAALALEYLGSQIKTEL